MRCMACGTGMNLVEAIPDDTMPIPGFEHHTFKCSACDDVERRLVFTKYPAQGLAEPEPVQAAPPDLSISTLHNAHTTSPGILRRVFAMLRSGSHAGQ